MIKKINNSIKTGNFFEKLFCMFLIILGFSNNKIMTLECRNKKYKKIKKKYSKVLDKKYSYEYDNKKNNIIWFCWLQGYDNLPKLARRCLSSIKEYCNDSKIIFVDKDNYSDYVELPDYIIKKWKNGIISNAHFSDIIRTCLLVEHGGLWIDSSVILLDYIPDYIYSSNCFMFNMEGEDDILTYNNWFIYSCKNNRVFKYMRDLLFEFWKKENKVQDYFIWHIFMKMVYDKYTEDFHCMTYVPHSSTHVLYHDIINNSKCEIEHIKRIYPIQKLSYKYDIDCKNNYYNFINGILDSGDN